MKRVLVIVGVIAAAGLAAVVVAAAKSNASTYRLDIVFDDARGLVPGQLLEIAGGRAGTISDVRLADHFTRALVQVDVDQRFAPFRTTATCAIRPQGLIAENYVACDPGDPSSPPLRPQGDTPPTVPVSHTLEPVTLTDLFNIANLPTRERLTVLLDELGVGATAQGEDINAILRRANPALALARRAIGILQSQQAELAATIDATDPVVAQLASHRAQARAFVASAARVTGQLADHRQALGQSVQRLPPLLSATRPALQELDTVATQSTPLLVQLRLAAPMLQRLSFDLPPLVAASGPALYSLGQALRRGAVVARQLTPTTKLLQSYAQGSLPNVLLTERLLLNLEQTGFFDNFLAFAYHAAAAAARFDTVSHILPAHTAFNQCSGYATEPVAGCNANYSAPAATTSAQRGRQAAVHALLRYLLR